jgi:hypothetical protein
MSKTKQAYDLTDAEKRDLIQLIQQGKALPTNNFFVTYCKLYRISGGD